MNCTLTCRESELAKPGCVQGGLPVVEDLESTHLAVGECPDREVHGLHRRAARSTGGTLVDLGEHPVAPVDQLDDIEINRSEDVEGLTPGGSDAFMPRVHGFLV